VSKDSLVVGFENNKSIKIQERIKRNICDLDGKGNCMLATLYKGAANNGATVISQDNITWRKLTPIECERLQTVPDNYTNHVSNSQRYKMLGNGWTVDIIVHIFKNIKTPD
jgi:site-specific DNA-cytosine methylase